MYSESLVTEGLALHPLEKMKLPMSIEAVKNIRQNLKNNSFTDNARASR